MRGIYDRMGMPALKGWGSERLTLYNDSRIVGVVGEEDVVGAENIRLVVIDEAARVSVDVFRAVVPMLALSNGRMVCLSTPFGKRGFFYEAWVKGGSDWERIEVPGERVVPFRRGYRSLLEMERGAGDEGWFRREYCCSFEEVDE
jgi:hypothetical protein